MKLIKQNDNAGGLIFKQNNNGKAMKQNYNFGNGFFKGLNTKCYIEAPIVPSNMKNLSLISWLDVSTSGYTPVFKIVNNDRHISSSIRNDGLYRFMDWPIDGSGEYQSASFNIPRGKTLIIVLINSINIRVKSNNLEKTGNFGPFFNSTAPTTLLFAIGNFFYSTVYQEGLQSDIMMYDRVISDDECKYLFNNELGNEPLSTLGLSLHYSMNVAEILPFKGIDAVCVRDLTGNNNHGKILGIPAGTLQEQLDYANTNLFKSW